jgi:pyrimidine/purine-5'-nucleotide nucleosidase
MSLAATPGAVAGVVPAAMVAPETSLAILSQREVNALCSRSNRQLHEVFRRCALAVLASGTAIDDARTLLERYRDFTVTLVQQDRGLRLRLENAPANAFVGGEMIRGVREHLFAVLRDIVYITQELESGAQFDLASPAGITDAVFKILRNAGVFTPAATPGLVVCWGGHAISRHEYDYTKEVGYALGLHGLDVCTGCGPGAMKGPMKGATIAHAKQRIASGRYIGISEPGIIAAEAPNPIVNQLVIMPDMEKRLEAFVRLGHGIVIFPGGVGTAEELLYLLGILSLPENADQPLPVILSGPRESAGYFASLDRFVALVLGADIRRRYRIIVDDPPGVAAGLASAIGEVLRYRDDFDDAPYFNWRLQVGADYQVPFPADHAAMAELVLSRDLPPATLASNLRRAFSGIVAGNVKESGIAAVERDGPFRLRGEALVVEALDALLASFIADGRMRLPGREYRPCYELVR